MLARKKILHHFENIKENVGKFLKIRKQCKKHMLALQQQFFLHDNLLFDNKQQPLKLIGVEL